MPAFACLFAKKAMQALHVDRYSRHLCIIQCIVDICAKRTSEIIYIIPLLNPLNNRYTITFYGKIFTPGAQGRSQVHLKFIIRRGCSKADRYASVFFKADTGR